MDNKNEANLVLQDDRNVTINRLDFPVHFLQVRFARVFDESDETISFFSEVRTEL